MHLSQRDNIFEALALFSARHTRLNLQWNNNIPITSADDSQENRKQA